jgi:hypothetical protein
VVTAAPCIWIAKTRHDRMAAPSARTVQAPQTPCSQPRWVPVSGQVSRDSLAVAGVGVHVGGEGDVRHRGPADRHRVEVGRGRAARRLFGGPGPDRHRRHAEQPEPQAPHPAGGVDLDGAGRAGQREVPVPPRHFHDRAALWMVTESDLGHDLVRLRDRHQRAGEELRRADRPRAAHAGQVDLGIEGHRHGRVLRGRVGVAYRPADRAPVPDLEVADPRRRVREQPDPGSHVRAARDRGLGGHRADRVTPSAALA